MKPDLYTKAVLTVIAFMLVMIGCRQYVIPTTTVHAEGPFAGVQFSGNSTHFTLFDSRTGDIWEYQKGFDGSEHTKISSPGSAVKWLIK
jgi:hypothetical protein